MQFVKNVKFDYTKKTYNELMNPLNYLLYYSTRGYINFFDHEKLINYDQTFKDILENITHPVFESRCEGLICFEKGEELTLREAIKITSNDLIDVINDLIEFYSSNSSVKAFFMNFTNKNEKDYKETYLNTLNKLKSDFSDLDNVEAALREQRPHIFEDVFLNENFISIPDSNVLNPDDKFYLVTFLYMKNAVQKGRSFDISELTIDYHEYIDLNNYMQPTDVNSVSNHRVADIVYYLKGEHRQNIPLYLKEVKGVQGLYSEASDKLIFESKEKAISFLKKMQNGDLEYLSNFKS